MLLGAYLDHCECLQPTGWRPNSMRQSPHGLSKLALSFLLFLPHRGPTTFPDGPALQAQAAWISTPPPWVCLSPLPAPTCKFLLLQCTSSMKPSFTKSTPPMPQPSPSCPQAELLTWLCCLMFWFWNLSHPARCQLGAESQKLLYISWGSLGLPFLPGRKKPQTWCPSPVQTS